jgi:S1-C subfamily serine protease
MAACQRCGGTAVSKPHGAVGHTVDAESDLMQAGAHPSHRWVPVNEQRRTRARSAGSILRDLGVVTIAAVIGFAVVVLIRHTPLGKRLFDVGSAQLQPKDELVTYLPSVVTLQIKQGDHSVQGSGIILTTDGLSVANIHVVAPASDRPQEPTTIVATLSDGRTAGVKLIAADPNSDIAILRIQDVSRLTLISTRSSAGLRGAIGAGYAFPDDDAGRIRRPTLRH